MKTKDIDKAADDYARKEWAGGGFECASNDSFFAGAQWRINSVWHDKSEMPADGEVILIVTEDNHPIICGPNNSDFFKTLIDLRMERWTYIKDLLPIEEGEK